MAPIFDLQYTQETSKSIHTSLSMLPDSENLGSAFGIVFLSCLQYKIWILSGLEAAFSDFSLPVRSCNVLDCPIGLLDLKNIDIASKHVFISCRPAEIWVLPV